MELYVTSVIKRDTAPSSRNVDNEWSAMYGRWNDFILSVNLYNGQKLFWEWICMNQGSDNGTEYWILDWIFEPMIEQVIRYQYSRRLVWRVSSVYNDVCNFTCNTSSTGICDGKNRSVERDNVIADCLQFMLSYCEGTDNGGKPTDMWYY